MKFPKDVLADIKQHLLSEKKKIETRLESLKMQDPFSDPDRLIDNAASDTDAKEESSHERVEALEKELMYHLEEVNQTLVRIEDGSYAICLDCKKMIDTDRLAAKTTALYCFACERKKEYIKN